MWAVQDGCEGPQYRHRLLIGAYPNRIRFSPSPPNAMVASARLPVPDTVTTTPSPHRSWNTVSPAIRSGGSRRAGDVGPRALAGLSFSMVRTNSSGISRRNRDGGL